MTKSTGLLLAAGFILTSQIIATAAPDPSEGSTAKGSKPAPTFARKPTAVRDGDTIKIDFAASRQTDVTVCIENAAGRIVRHLAAGSLGKNPPPPLKADSLEQSISWDGKDDDGKKVSSPPDGLRVRVGLGLTASYAGLAFADPDKTGPNRLVTITGLAAGPDGRLYVMDQWSGLAWWSISRIHVVRRDGSYEKTIKPFPSNLPADRLKGIGAFVNSFGAINPLIYRAEGTSFYPQEEVAQQPAITPDGRIVLATKGNISCYDRPTCHLSMIDTDGGVPEGGFAGAALGSAWATNPSLVSAADGKSVYFVGLGGGKTGANAVYIAKLAKDGPAGPPEVFFGAPATAGNDQAHLSAPKSLAADGKGHLFVADSANNRIVVLNEKDKSYAGAFSADSPWWVAVHPKSGAVYVCSKSGLQAHVLKYSNWAAALNDPKEPAVPSSLPSADVGGLVNQIHPALRSFSPLCLALDGSADRAILWAGCGSLLVRFEDQGGKFSATQPADCAGSQFFFRPASDPTRQQVACRTERGKSGWGDFSILDEATGKVRLIGEKGVSGKEGRTHRLGPDGCIYAVDCGVGIVRFDPDGKPKPFAATLKDPLLKGRLPVGQTGTTMWERDFWIDRKNDIYVRRNGSAYHGRMTVEVYDQDGNFKRTVLWMVSDGMYGPRVDAQGNLYVMDVVKPLDQPFPEEFKGRITAKGPAGYSGIHWYDVIYGSVIKFSPAGGAIWFSTGGAMPSASPLSYEGWRAWSSVPRQWAELPGDADNSVVDLKIAGGSLTAKIAKKPATLAFPWPTTLDAATQNKLTFRLKNDSDGTAAVLGYHVVGEGYGVEAKTRTIDIKPNSDFAEYTFDLSGEKTWKGNPFNLTLVPTNGAKGSFSIDWVRVGEVNSKLVWKFDTDDSADTKLPATLKKEQVGAYGCPAGAQLQGALWWQPGFGHVGIAHNNDHCHCCGSDFDMDDFARVFAPDTGRFRIGVLDSNGNPILSFGAYGNQDFCGPDSYVVDPATKLLRPRKNDDPRDLVSPFAQPGNPQIAFGWIIGVAVTDQYAYVDDFINMRVLRVKLGHAAAETVAVP